MEPKAALVSTRRSRLRQAPNTLHRTIDDLIVGCGCFSGHDRYNAYLLATLRARAPVEMRLDESGAEQVFESWPLRRLAPALRADLFDLERKSRLPGPASPAAERLDPPRILGALDVLEGSSLGAAILKRQAAAIGLTASYGARHLNQQSASPKMWPVFLQHLEAYDLTATDDDRCVEAAVQTFQGFEHAYRSMC